MNNAIDDTVLTGSRRSDRFADVPPKEPLGTLAAAVALQESGILVHAMTVTDLSSGYSVTGVNPDVTDPFLAAEGEPRFRGSPLGLKQLEALRELVLDVLEHRKKHPEWAQMDTPIPRDDFPWGVGMPEPDVVVAGAHAGIIADYLRCVGVRARKIDADRALWIAGDLEDARLRLAQWEEEDAEDATERKKLLRWPVPSRDGSLERSPLKLAAGIAAVLLFAVGGISVAAVVGGDADHEPAVEANGGRGGVEEKEREAEKAGEEPVPPSDDPPTRVDPWREHHIQGEEMQMASVARADVPVRMELPGWTRVGATADREEFMSSDPDMRVLVSAKQTPLDSQEKLDGAVLKVIEDTEGVRVAGRSPVSYEEAYPESTTIWHVRLVDGHQVSVGCQFREVTGPRLETCDRAAAAAGPQPAGDPPQIS